MHVYYDTTDDKIGKSAVFDKKKNDFLVCMRCALSNTLVVCLMGQLT